MTILLGRRGDKEPFTCAICGRRAQSGYSTRDTKPIAWICDDSDGLPDRGCIRAIRKVYDMAAPKLDAFERRAIERASEKAIDPLFGVLLNALHDGGVRNLEEMDGDQYSRIADALTKSPELREAFETFLSEFGASIKEQIGAGEAPF